MGKQDIAQIEFLRDTGHFADIWNGLVFGGRQVIDSKELKEISPVGIAPGDDSSSKRTADMVMAKTRDGEKLGIYITENQMTVDYSIPVRILLREVMEYDRQLSEIVKRNRRNAKKEARSGSSGEFLYGFRKEDRLRPVSTIVLFWDDEWDGPRTMYDLLDFNGVEEMKDLVTDFPLNVINVSKIKNEEKIFQNREVRDVMALYFRRNDKKQFKAYVDEYGKEVSRDSMRMISAMVASSELKDYLKRVDEKKGDEENLCLAITELIQDGRNEGWINGLAEGKVEGKAEGLAEGEKLFADLVVKLEADGRSKDISKCAVDQQFREQMYIMYGLKHLK